MNTGLKRIISAGLICFTLLMAGAGCGKEKQTTSTDNAASTSSESMPGTTSDKQSNSYPIETKETLTYWCGLNSSLVSPNFKNFGDTPFAQELQKETGVTLQFIHPSIGTETQSFNLLVASGNMPDIVETTAGTGWSTYPGGPEAAINDNVILKLNSYFEKDAPDLKKILDSDKNYDKMVKTDSGNYYIFPYMKRDVSLNTTYGLTIRTDWLKELNLKTPETIDDWYTVLKAFKEQKGATAPLSYAGSGDVFYPFKNGVFIGAYGITKAFYLDGSTVKFGPNENAYKDWLATMAKWYKEGLLDTNFATNDQKAMDANILGNKTGSLPTWPGSGLGKYIPALQQKDPAAVLAPAPYPVLKAGDKPQFTSLLNAFDGGGACITTSCKNPDLAAKFLNYGYSEKGILLYNYGIEGVSYTMENGVPKMTDEVMKNPKGLPVGQAWSMYAHGVYPGLTDCQKHYLDMYYVLPEQKNALTLWTNSDMDKHLMPPVSPTTEESQMAAKIMNDVNAYVDEYTLKVIMGNDSVNNFDNYLSQLKKLDIDKAISIQQAAYDRFTKR